MPKVLVVIFLIVRKIKQFKNNDFEICQNTDKKCFCAISYKSIYDEFLGFVTGNILKIC